MESSKAIAHPLYPLTIEEIQVAVAVIKSQQSYSRFSRFISVALKEPDKSVVKKNMNYSDIHRHAFVVLFNNETNSCFEIIVDIDLKTVVSWKHIPGVQPTMSTDEQIECEQAVLNSPEFIQAILEYGIEDPALVMVDIWSAGFYGSEEEKSMRLARPLCFLRSDSTDNGYSKPIEGLRPVVDLNTMKVIGVENYGYTPIQPNDGNYSMDRLTEFRSDIKPLEISQPQGPSFTVTENSIEWQKWSFIIGFNPREGLTLHDINYTDNREKRSILYRASLSEMVVPYGDPSETQKRKNAFDTGEYGMGTCANSLELGCDCLGLIKYFDANFTDSRGNIVTVKNAICMHEEDYGILWKHTDRRIGKPEVRRSRRLVVSSFSTVENYEYGFFWYFYQDGNIQFEIKLTGILSLGSLLPDVKPKYGNFVAPGLYAPNHQHFFSVRLDFDLDGEDNSVYEVNILPENEGTNEFKNAFFAQSTLRKTEIQAQSNVNIASSRYWKIVNHSRKNAIGEPVAYKFLPGDNCLPFASKESFWRQRAGFVDNHVWVTPFNAAEYFAAGDYPNQSQGGEGINKWTEEDRNIEDTDIVFWYTMGHTHIPRPEDYPVMPTAYIGFLLKPLGFFNQNPANDVPSSKHENITKTNSPCCH